VTAPGEEKRGFGSRSGQVKITSGFAKLESGGKSKERGKREEVDGLAGQVIEKGRVSIVSRARNWRKIEGMRPSVEGSLLVRGTLPEPGGKISDRTAPKMRSSRTGAARERRGTQDRQVPVSEQLKYC